MRRYSNVITCKNGCRNDDGSLLPTISNDNIRTSARQKWNGNSKHCAINRCYFLVESIASSILKAVYRRSRYVKLLMTVLLAMAYGRIWWQWSNSTKDAETSTGVLSKRASPRGRIFYCGYRVPLAKYIFPDYEFVGELPDDWDDWDERGGAIIPGHENDILVIGMWGPQCNPAYAQERTSFSGKILYVNGEPEGDAVSQAWREKHTHQLPNVTEEVYQIGPYPPRADGSPDVTMDNFYNAHSLQVYHTAMEFMGFIYLSSQNSSEVSPTSDIDPFAPSSDEEIVTNGAENQHQRIQAKHPPIFNAWKQLVQGNGRSRDAGPEQPRIPAVVYVSRNCVPFRQEAAELLVEEFASLATSGVVVSKGAEHQPSKGNESRVLGSSHSKAKGSIADEIQALHQRLAGRNPGGSFRNPELSKIQALRHRMVKLNESRAAGNPDDPLSPSPLKEIQQELHDAGGDPPILTTDRYSRRAIEFDDAPSSFVHYGGECRVEGGIPVPSGVLEGWENTQRSQFRTNYETIYTRYKYCLVMENTRKEGYVTEKLMHALLGGCLPIYNGSKDVYNIFREDAFVYFDIENPRAALDEIWRLENNDAEYKRRTDRSLPLLKSTGRDHRDTSRTVDNYFSLIPNIGTGKLCKDIHKMMGLPLPESLLPKTSFPKSGSWRQRL